MNVSMGVALLVLILVPGAGGLAAASDSRAGAPDRFTDLFRPIQSELASLSPDGRYLAYTYRERDVVSVVVVDLEQPQTVKARVLVVDDARATPRFNPVDERTPAAVRWMRWVTATRLVVETNAQAAVGADRSLPGTVLAFDADGGQARLLLNARSIEENLPVTQLQRGVRDRRPLGPTVDNPNFANASQAGPTDPNEPGVRPPPGSDDPLTGSLFAPLGSSADPEARSTAADPRFEVISRPLVPSVFDLDAQAPGSVLVRAVGAASSLIYSVDAHTGALRLRSDHPYDPEELTLQDRQGVPRISVPSTTLRPFPHAFRLDRGPGSRQGVPLQQVVDPSTPSAFTVAPETFFRQRALPLGFDERPEILYFASNLDRDTFGIYSVDLVAGKRTDVAIEHPRLDLIPRPDGAFVPPGTLVFDRHTRKLAGVRTRDPFRGALWLNASLKAVQEALARTLPGRNIDLLEWDTKGHRFLAAINGPSDAGGFVVFDAATRQAREFARRAPWLDQQLKNQTVAVTLDSKTRRPLSCHLTLSRHAKVKPMPVIVICPAAPWERVPTDFQPEVQALADMGFAVVQMDGRGAWGYGVKHRERVHDGYATAQVEELLNAVEGLAKAFTLDLQRVGLIGVGYGGHLALRAVQAHPARFRCAVTLDAPIDLQRWLSEDRWTTRDVTPQLLRSHYGGPEELRAAHLTQGPLEGLPPLFLLSYPGRDGEWRRTAHLETQAFARRARARQAEVVTDELSEAFVRGLPQARSAVYREIELFFNTYVYDFSVKIGETAVQEDPPAPR